MLREALDNLLGQFVLRIERIEDRLEELGLLETPTTLPPDPHALVGADHTASGLTTGQPLRATGATSFAFGALDLGNANAVTGTLAIARLGTTQSPTFNQGTFTGAVTMSGLNIGGITGGGTGIIQHARDADAGTNDDQILFRSRRGSSGTVADGFGLGWEAILETATGGTFQVVGQIIWDWVVAANATRSGRGTVNVLDSAGSHIAARFLPDGLTVPLGLNVGSESGAATGEIRSSGQVAVTGGTPRLDLGALVNRVLSFYDDATNAMAFQVRSSEFNFQTRGGVPIRFTKNDIGDASNAAADAVMMSIRSAGGVEIGSQTSDPGLGSLRADGYLAAATGVRPDNSSVRAHYARTVTLADDATTTLTVGGVTVPYGFYFIRDNTDGHSAIIHTRGGVNTAHVVYEVVAASWATADTDTKHCVYHNGTVYLLKNRRGGSRTYTIQELTLN